MVFIRDLILKTHFEHFLSSSSPSFLSPFPVSLPHSLTHLMANLHSHHCRPFLRQLFLSPTTQSLFNATYNFTFIQTKPPPSFSTQSQTPLCLASQDHHGLYATPPPPLARPPSSLAVGKIDLTSWPSEFVELNKTPSFLRSS